MRIERHPTLDILVRSNGEVLVPQNGTNPAHWTFGSKDRYGYLRVQINGKRYQVHRLVAETFIQFPIPEGLQADHISRDRADNRVENIRLVTPSTNCRNTEQHDRVDARGGTHWYENEKQYKKEWGAKRNKTHRHVRFSDGKPHWVPNEQATILLKLPVKERKYGKMD